MITYQAVQEDSTCVIYDLVNSDAFGNKDFFHHSHRLQHDMNHYPTCTAQLQQR